MALKRKLASLDEVDKKFHDLYEEAEDGSFVLDLDDDDADRGSKGKLAEFRSNNRKLHAEKKRLEERLKAYGDADPEELEEALEAREKLRKLEGKKLIESGDLEAAVQQSVEAAKKKHEKQLKTIQQTNEELRQSNEAMRERLSQAILDTRATEAVSKFGTLRKGALPDLMHRARSTFELDEKGELKAREGHYGADAEPLTMDQWAKGLLDQAEHLFVPSRGGGGAGNDAPSPGSGRARTIDPHDNSAFIRNLEAIRDGKVRVGGEGGEG